MAGVPQLTAGALLAERASRWVVRGELSVVRGGRRMREGSPTEGCPKAARLARGLGPEARSAVGRGLGAPLGPFDGQVPLRDFSA